MTRYGLPVMFEAVFRALNDRGVRYLVAGGVAVVLHGHMRYTKDLDLVVDLAPHQATAAIETLSALGLVPSVPVDPLAFADAETRQAWVHEKGMTVLSLRHPDDIRLVVDLFVEPPADFEMLWDASDEMPLETTTVRVISLDDLIAMKRNVGRPRDMLDVDELEQIKRLREEGL
jgi:predicted nucleotidyltransferase